MAAVAWAELLSLDPNFHEVPVPGIRIEHRDVMIGRGAGCGVVIPIPSISGEHCMVSFRVSASSGKKEPYIVDKSTNGTLINKKRIEKDKRKLLKSGDIISLANDLHFRFVSHLDAVDVSKVTAFVSPTPSPATPSQLQQLQQPQQPQQPQPSQQPSPSPSQTISYAPPSALLQQLQQQLQHSTGSLYVASSSPVAAPAPQPHHSPAATFAALFTPPTQSQPAQPQVQQPFQQQPFQQQPQQPFQPPSFPVQSQPTFVTSPELTANGILAHAGEGVAILMNPDLARLLVLKQTLRVCEYGWLHEFGRLGGLVLLFDLFNELERRSNPDPLHLKMMQRTMTCLTVLINEPLFLEPLLNSPALLPNLVSWLNNPVTPVKVRVQTIQILASIAVFSAEGHAAVCEAFRSSMEYWGERYRFRLLANLLVMEDSVPLRVASLGLANALICFSQPTRLRQHIRDEFLAVNFESLLQVLKRLHEPELNLQITTFENSRLEDSRELLAGSFEDPKIVLHSLLAKTTYTPAYQTLNTILHTLHELPDPSSPEGCSAWARLDQQFRSSSSAVAEAAPVTPTSSAGADAALLAQHSEQIAALKQAHQEALERERAKYQELVEVSTAQKASDNAIIAHLHACVAEAESQKSAQVLLAASAAERPRSFRQSSSASLHDTSMTVPIHSQRVSACVPSRPMTKVLWSKIPPSSIGTGSMWAQKPWEKVPLEVQVLEGRFSLVDPVAQVSSVNRNVSALLGAHRCSQTFALLEDLKLSPEAFHAKINSVNFSSISLVDYQQLSQNMLSRDDLTLIDQLSKEPSFNLSALPADERFWVLAAKSPFFDLRIHVIVRLLSIPDQLQETARGCTQVISACAEIRGSATLSELIIFVLAIGNFCNYNPAAPGCGYADAFKLEYLPKLSNIRSIDGSDLFQYLAGFLSSMGAPHLLRLKNELAHLDQAARLNVKELSAAFSKYTEKLSGLTSVIRELTSVDASFAQAVASPFAALQMNLASLKSDVFRMDHSLETLSEHLAIPRSDPSFKSVFSALSEFVAKLSKASHAISRHSVTADTNDTISADLSLTVKRQQLLEKAYRAVRKGDIKNQAPPGKYRLPPM
ncbi:MAG: FHA domain-containing protein [archaeon]|nr:FHA domain-containing protein [archaeon]